MKKVTFFILFAFIGLNTQQANAQYTKLVDFNGSTNGSNPYGSLTSVGGFLYGMTYAGGTNNLGTIFRMMPNGNGYEILLNFSGATNGSNPRGALISDGTFLYGMTQAGGTNDKGTIFKMIPDGSSFTKLFDFNQSTDGSNPYGELISDGTFLYGLASGGGDFFQGTLFKIMPDGSNYTVLIDFDNTTKGASPIGSLIFDGTFLYGTTMNGGANNKGTIFKIKPDGTSFIKLFDFAGATNGSLPKGSLLSEGAFLYGTTSSGGVNDFGTIFKIMPDGSGFTKLLDLDGATNGSNPTGTLISDGFYLYGLTGDGGANDFGTIFNIDLNGSNYTKLLDFDEATSGEGAFGSLIFDGPFLYGTTFFGGANDIGVVFKYLTTASLKKMNIDSEITIYPNPNDGIFQVKSETNISSIEISNVLGKKIYAEQINADKTEINLGKQVPGIYFYELKNEVETLKVGKIIIE